MCFFAMTPTPAEAAPFSVVQEQLSLAFHPLPLAKSSALAQDSMSLILVSCTSIASADDLNAAKEPACQALRFHESIAVSPQSLAHVDVQEAKQQFPMTGADLSLLGGFRARLPSSKITWKAGNCIR